MCIHPRTLPSGAAEQHEHVMPMVLHMFVLLRLHDFLLDLDSHPEVPHHHQDLISVFHPADRSDADASVPSERSSTITKMK